MNSMYMKFAVLPFSSFLFLNLSCVVKVLFEVKISFFYDFFLNQSSHFEKSVRIVILDVVGVNRKVVINIFLFCHLEQWENWSCRKELSERS